MTNSTQAVGGLKGAPDAPLDREMAAYDQMPPEVRRALQQAPIKPHCASMANQTKAVLSQGMKPSLLASKIEGELKSATQTLARSTYGRSHPQA